ncbi:endoplasmic reticulum resident protein 27 isoform X1 [Chamaea fasciata]|uniref:endoplasmic reticulum resident protein 27 isoform X1 n=1 Tax=Chamaea fasciata TaxID=190680 RepID=UPI00336AC797
MLHKHCVEPAGEVCGPSQQHRQTYPVKRHRRCRSLHQRCRGGSHWILPGPAEPRSGPVSPGGRTDPGGALRPQQQRRRPVPLRRGGEHCRAVPQDSDRRDLDMNNRDVDAEKLTRFIRMNELRLVTEYNPVTAIGVMQSSLEFNLLLITDKMSPKHPERMRKFRTAAELYKGKILFILLDSNLKTNERVLSYFQLKKSQLPSLAIFHTPDDEHVVLNVDEISIERVQDFCNNFLQRIQKKEDKSEDKPLNEEL